MIKIDAVDKSYHCIDWIDRKQWHAQFTIVTRSIGNLVVSPGYLSSVIISRVCYGCQIKIGFMTHFKAIDHTMGRKPTAVCSKSFGSRDFKWRQQFFARGSGYLMKQGGMKPVWPTH